MPNVSYELNLKRRKFNPVALDAELRATLGNDIYAGLSTYGHDRPVTVFIQATPTDELAALIEAVGAEHIKDKPETDLPVFVSPHDKIRERLLAEQQALRPTVPDVQPVKTRRKRG